ncbi:hypothetical protein OKW38_002969 [Paraburkholderia sp. MM5496-R1]|uniref:hypothetical protein n=1 Tax=unclassified Paraburkholderia TaxID=2615204 RepID=UPI003D2081F1
MSERTPKTLTARVRAPVDPDGGAHLPWGPHLSPDDMFGMRAELAELIEDMADAEDWPASYRDEVLARAMRGPLHDLLPNLHYFRERVAEFSAECEARALLRRRAWRANEDLSKRGYSEARGTAATR